MEEDEIQRQVCKFQRVSSNGSTTSDNSSNPHKIAAGGGGGGGIDGGGGGGGGGRLCGWPSSRIVRVSRASGGKDRHSKVLTSKGLRDRRVRLSVSTAIQFYDLQDRLGYDQPSKAVEWLLKAAAASIEELPSLDPSFHNHHNNEDPNHRSNNVSRSSACSSTSETSKGSGLSLSRSENRIKARERAREMATMKEKEFDSAPTAAVLNGVSQNSSFTDLLTGGTSGGRSPMDYFFCRTAPPQFHITTGDDNHHQQQQQQQQLSFLQENFSPVGKAAGGDGETYNLNFSMASSSSGAGLSPGFNRGTLQSNLPSSLLTHHHHHLQRFQPSQMDGSASTNLPFFIVPNAVSDPFPATGGYDAQRLQLYYGGGEQPDQHKDKAKN